MSKKIQPQYRMDKIPNDPTETAPVSKEIKLIDIASRWLDSQFRIPGTDIRFGLDAVIGLVPYVGDLVTYVFSSILMITMVRHGASGMVILKMLFNVLLDTVIGLIPFIGDLFDLQYRANRRNYKLLTEHYQEGQHTGSAWPAIIITLLVLIGLFWAVIYFAIAGVKALVGMI